MPTRSPCPARLFVPHADPLTVPGPVVVPHADPLTVPGPAVVPHADPLTVPGIARAPHVSPFGVGPAVVPHADPLTVPGIARAPHVSPFGVGPAVVPHADPLTVPGIARAPHVSPFGVPARPLCRMLIRCTVPGIARAPHVSPFGVGPAVVPHADPLTVPGIARAPHVSPFDVGPAVVPHADPLTVPGIARAPHVSPFGVGPVVPPHADPLTVPGIARAPHVSPFDVGPAVVPHADPLTVPGPAVVPHADPLTVPGVVAVPHIELPTPLANIGSFRTFATTADARSAGNVLDQLLTLNPTDAATPTLAAAQAQLVNTLASLQPAQVEQFLTALGGQIHAAMVAVAPEAGQQMEGSVYDHLGDVAGEPGTGPLVWGNVSTEFGQRGSDSTAESFTSNVTQFVVGADLLARGKARLGLGYAYTTDTVTQGSSNGAAHENAGFVYGQVPVGKFMVEGIGSYGASSTDTQRADPLGGSMLEANGVGGNDALVSLGVSRPFTFRNVALAPYGRVTWQQVSEASYSEGSSSAASLSVDSFAGTGVRGVIGLTAGSVETSPLAAPTTYRFDLGVGEDAGNLLNPSLRANLAGIRMTIASPQVSSTFVQASVSGTARLSPSAYLYGQLFGEARGNSAMGGISGGVRIRF